MAKILVTGGYGFLGSRVVAKLQSFPQYEVLPYSRRNGLDLTHLELAKKVFADVAPDIVVHCAAHVGGIAYNYLHPVEVFEDNTHIGLNVVKACVETGVKQFVNVMPNCVYPGAMDEYEESKWWDGPIHDSVLTYGLPRKMLWGSCFAHLQKTPDFHPIHLIFPNMYGPGDHFEAVRSHALGAMIAKIVEAKRHGVKSVDIWGTGKPVREWIYVDDAATAVQMAIDKMAAFARNEIMNIGVTKGISILDMAHLIRELAGWNGEFALQPEKPDGAMKKILIAKKMQETLSWTPPTSIQAGIRQTIEWYEKSLLKA